MISYQYAPASGAGLEQSLPGGKDYSLCGIPVMCKNRQKKKNTESISSKNIF
jgi:hypothetical protein